MEDAILDPRLSWGFTQSNSKAGWDITAPYPARPNSVTRRRPSLLEGFAWPPVATHYAFNSSTRRRTRSVGV